MCEASSIAECPEIPLSVKSISPCRKHFYRPIQAAETRWQLLSLERANLGGVDSNKRHKRGSKLRHLMVKHLSKRIAAAVGACDGDDLPPQAIMTLSAANELLIINF